MEIIKITNKGDNLKIYLMFSFGVLNKAEVLNKFKKLKFAVTNKIPKR